MRLKTERLIIRPIKESDLDDFYEYRSDPKVCEFQGYQPILKESAKEYIRALQGLEFGNAGEWVQVGIELKSGGKMIGDIGLKPEKHEPRIVEFGISFSTKHQQKGFAKEALIKIFSYLFEEKNVHRIIGIMDVNNLRMIGLIENLGFRREGNFIESFWDEEKKVWCDEFLYAMLKKDWKMNLQ